MSIQVKIPAVGESISSGVLSTWHKRSGDYVNSGEVLFTLETDKVSTEITAEKAGRLQINVDAGTEVKIGEVVGEIDETSAQPNGSSGTQAPAPTETKSAAPAAGPVPPASRRMLEEEKMAAADVAGTGKGGHY